MTDDQKPLQQTTDNHPSIHFEWTCGLERDIDVWVENELAEGNIVPDFWDENSTSERLAEYLVSKGWRKSA